MSEPDKTMTNASVTEVVMAVQGRVLKVKYTDGTSELIVGPDVPITALVVVGVAALKSGMKVTITAAKAADGTMAATRIGERRGGRNQGPT